MRVKKEKERGVDKWKNANFKKLGMKLGSSQLISESELSVTQQLLNLDY